MFRLVFKMALKSAFIRKKRSLLVMAMIAASMSTMIAIEGLYDGMSENMIDSVLRTGGGEVSLYAQQYRLTQEVRYNIPDAASITKSIAALPGVREATWRLCAEGLAQTASKSQGAQMRGVAMAAENAFGALDDFLIAGDGNLTSHTTVVGSALAKKLKLGVGSKVIFSTVDSHNEMQSVALRVRGIVRTSNIAIDERALYVTRERAAAVAALAPEDATEIALRTSHAHTLQKELFTRFGKLDIKRFDELNPQLTQMQEMTRVFNAIFFVIVMVVVFIGILGVMYVSVIERLREFGMLRCIGYRFSQMALQVGMEALLLGLGGFLMGSAAAFGMLYYLHVKGLDLSYFAEGLESFGMQSTIYASMESFYFTSTFAAVMLAALLSVVLPLAKIARLNPVDVLKE